MEIVENEIKGFKEISFVQGIDIESCLINPKLQKYKSGFKENTFTKFEQMYTLFINLVRKCQKINDGFWH